MAVRLESLFADEKRIAGLGRFLELLLRLAQIRFGAGLQFMRLFQLRLRVLNLLNRLLKRVRRVLGAVRASFIRNHVVNPFLDRSAAL